MDTPALWALKRHAGKYVRDITCCSHLHDQQVASQRQVAQQLRAIINNPPGILQALTVYFAVFLSVPVIYSNQEISNDLCQ